MDIGEQVSQLTLDGAELIMPLLMESADSDGRL